MSRIVLAAVAGLVLGLTHSAIAEPAASGVAVAATEAAAAPSEPAPTSEPTAATSTPAPAAPAEPAQATAPATPAPLPPPTLTVSINLAEQRMVVSEHGQAKYSWAISSGTSEYPTPRGTFRPQWTAKMWYSRKYDNAPMPHAVFINGGVAIHATYHTNALGRPASHGCIRLAPGNAKAFYSLVHRHGLKATKVSIHGTPKWRAPAVASRAAEQKRRYAAYEGSGIWFSDGWGYEPPSAYAPDFTYKRGYRNPSRKIYRYGASPYGYKRTGPRVVYAPRPRRKVYIYDDRWD